MKDDVISRKAAIDALWKALFKYEDDTEKQFQESDELDLSEWMVHRIFVQNMSDIDRQTILNLPSVERKGKWISVHDDIFADRYYCSCCKTEPICNDIEYILSNFCPNCGADMRGEQ